MESEAQPPQSAEQPQQQQQQQILQPSVMDPSQQQEQLPQEPLPSDPIIDPMNPINENETNTNENVASFDNNNVASFDNNNVASFDNNNNEINSNENPNPNPNELMEEVPNPENISPMDNPLENPLYAPLDVNVNTDVDSIPNPDIQIDDNIDQEQQSLYNEQKQQEEQMNYNTQMVIESQIQIQQQQEEEQVLVNDAGPNLPPDIPEDLPQENVQQEEQEEQIQIQNENEMMVDNDINNQPQDIIQQMEVNDNNKMLIDNNNNNNVQEMQQQMQEAQVEIQSEILPESNASLAQGENSMNIEQEEAIHEQPIHEQLQQQLNPNNNVNNIQQSFLEPQTQIIQQHEIKQQPQQMPEPMETDNIQMHNNTNNNNNNNNNKMQSQTNILPELVQCKNLLIEFISRPESEPFNEPVDWKGLNLPDYPLIITRPMDLGTVLSKLNNSKYKTADGFASDVRLVFKNAKSYNMIGSGIYVVAENLLKQFERRYARITKSSGNRRRKNNDKIKNGLESTYEQRTQFTKLIQDLEPNELGGVVELIDKKAPYALNDNFNNENGHNDDELEIEVYHIDSNTLKDLITHMTKVISNRGKKKKRNY